MFVRIFIFYWNDAHQSKWMQIEVHGTVGCFASKTDIPYNQAKMKVKKLAFFMTYQVVLDHGNSIKLILGLYLSCILCYGPKTMGYYPQNIWKMAIFWKLYTGQWRTLTLLIKIAPFFMIIWTLLTVFAGFCRFFCNGSFKIAISLLMLASLGTSTNLKLTWTDIFWCSTFDIH